MAPPRKRRKILYYWLFGSNITIPRCGRNHLRRRLLKCRGAFHPETNRAAGGLRHYPGGAFLA